MSDTTILLLSLLGLALLCAGLAVQLHRAERRVRDLAWRLDTAAVEIDRLRRLPKEAGRG
jgi:hypothetical protein